MSPAVGSEPDYPDVTPRDAQALREWHKAHPGGGVHAVWGPLSRLGLATVLVTAALDQALKLWLLFVFDLQAHGTVRLTPFLDLVVIWNKGISYGLLQQDGPVGRWVCWP